MIRAGRRSQASRGREEQTGKVVGHEVDVGLGTRRAAPTARDGRRVGARARPATVAMPRACGTDEVAGDVLEHGGARRVDAVPREEAVVGRGVGLRHEIGRDDVEHILERVAEAELRPWSAAHGRASRW